VLRLLKQQVLPDFDHPFLWAPVTHMTASVRLTRPLFPQYSRVASRQAHLLSQWIWQALRRLQFAFNLTTPTGGTWYATYKRGRGSLKRGSCSFEITQPNISTAVLSKTKIFITGKQTKINVSLFHAWLFATCMLLWNFRLCKLMYNTVLYGLVIQR
jgi:hypothetical protein